MEITAHLEPEAGEHAERRLRSDLIAWLTTVRASGQPVTVPVWFLLREGGTILIYSRPDKNKLSNIAENPRVSLVLDGSDVGSDVVRLEGSARVAPDEPAPADNPAYRAKYDDRIAQTFGTPEQFGELYSVPLVVTVRRVHA